MDRKLLAVMASGALALPMAAQAVDISVSGHINRAIVVGDKDELGTENDVTMVDGSASGSRFRMTGSEELDNGVTAGVNLEYGAGAAGGANPGLRHSAVYLSGAFGKLTLGNTPQATDGVPYASFDERAFLSGTELGCDFCSGYLPAYGGSRSQVIRYDTPALGPATVAVSSDGGDFVDAALRISGDMGDGGYMLNVGYGSTEDEQDNLVVSGAFKLSGGMHAKLTWGQTDPDVKDSKKLDYWHLGVGYNIGSTSIAATYTDHDAAYTAAYTTKLGDGVMLPHSGKSWGVGIGHQMGAVELYSGYKYLDTDDIVIPGRTYSMKDTGFFVVGSRIKFN